MERDIYIKIRTHEQMLLPLDAEQLTVMPSLGGMSTSY